MNATSQTANAHLTNSQCVAVSLVDDTKHSKHADKKALSRKDIRKRRKARIIVGAVAIVLGVVAMVSTGPIAGIAGAIGAGALINLLIDFSGLVQRWQAKQEEKKRQEEKKLEFF